MIETRPATIEDAEPISALLMANSPGRGGALHGDWPIGVVTEWIEGGALIVEAMDAHALACLPGREAILFINASNTRSLKAHARLGMMQVANFTLGEQAF